MILNILVIALMVAQFTPRGQAFLATTKGAAAIVVISALVILSDLPSALSGNVLSVLMIGLFGYTGYTHLPRAKVFFKEQARRLKR